MTPHSRMAAVSVVVSAVLLVFATAAPATEIVVKNDSVVGGGDGVIVGDFVVGEHAGARLTSTCNGTIVAVQILWLEGTPGHPASLQNGIHIYAGTTFPTPGAEWAILEGPVLTPGYMNEFRYLDEAQTIPLSVPITQGQQFYVTLEFGEPTDVGNGGPSVVRDTSGCQTGKNVLFALPGGWMNFCLYLTGDLAIRAVIECEEAQGACCFADGTCQMKTPTQCAQAGGTFKGAGTTCTPNTCPQPTGACCIPATHGCINLTNSDCSTVGGIWAGAQTSCATYVCFPSGACCLPDGSCQDSLSPEACAQLSGTFQGHNTQCATVSCPLPSGACCLPNGNCIVFVESNCDIVGGVWMGPQATCADNNSNGTADVCEACDGDCNCDGIIDFDDITPFVAALSGVQPCSFLNCDINDDGVVDFNDITPLVGLLSTGATCP